MKDEKPGLSRLLGENIKQIFMANGCGSWCQLIVGLRFIDYNDEMRMTGNEIPFIQR